MARPSPSVTRERGRDDHAPAVEETKAILRRLAGPDPQSVIEWAEAAVGDLEAAAEFAQEVGLGELQRAIEAAEDPELRVRGERALSAFRRFRAAAVGDSSGDHFHRGHDTDLRDAVEGSRQ